MSRKLCPKIILEGTRLTQKTDLAFALNEHPRIVGPRKYRYHSPLISAEWCAFTNFPWGRGLINFEDHEEVQAMETYRTWLKLFSLQKYYSWIIDRFHLSTQVFQSNTRGKDYDFSWLDKGLVDLGFHLVICFRPDESFEAAKQERLKVSGNPSQYDNLEIFMDEQQLFRDLAAGSKLPVLELDMSMGTLEDKACEVADWLESTNGLWAKV